MYSVYRVVCNDYNHNNSINRCIYRPGMARFATCEGDTKSNKKVTRRMNLDRLQQVVQIIPVQISFRRAYQDR
jgi:hypothetical protein